MKKNLIAGVWTPGHGCDRERQPDDPNDVIGLFAQADETDVKRAINSAADAFDTWADSSPQVRADLLDAVGTTILAEGTNSAVFWRAKKARHWPKPSAKRCAPASLFKFFAGEALRFSGDVVASVRKDVDVEVTREPLGVIGLITPWNFPIAIPAWKIAPALAYGNTVVFKPAELTPGCAHALATILHECGCPAGVFNLVMGSGSMIGPILANSPQVQAISFTGSERVGSGLAQTCGQSRKKLQLEMGGKNPMVVLDDADLGRRRGGLPERSLLFHRTTLYRLIAPDRAEWHP